MPPLAEPHWLTAARRYLGTKEIPGKRNNTLILRWWRAIRAPFTDDETPWCAAFVGGVLEENGIESSRSAAARSYVKWGTQLVSPCVGSIAVLWRGSPASSAGHVGFVVGRDGKGNIMLLGGNQANKVSIAAFPITRVLCYRYPLSMPAPDREKFDLLPLLATDGSVSKSEQ